MMKALQFKAESRSVELVEAPIPQIQCSNEVLIKVSFCGVCSLDTDIIKGNVPSGSEQLILGHEFNGVIMDVGEEVHVLQPGDEVIVDPNIGCNGCFYCRDGRPHFCKNRIENTIGSTRDGGWAEYVVCMEEQVYKKPPLLTFEQAVLVEPLSCVCYAYYSKIESARIGRRILIQGASLDGILFACLLHHNGHQKVTVLDCEKERLKYLEKLDLGCQLVGNFDEIKCQNGTFDYIIDCTGNSGVVEEGFSYLNPGGMLILFGAYPPDMQILISPFELYEKEIKIVGTFTNPFSFPGAIGVAAALGNRYLNYELLGIKVYGLEEYQQALQDIESKTITKAIFKIPSASAPQCVC